MADRNNQRNQENKGQQVPQERPFLEHGGYSEKSHPDGRTTTTSQKPAPGHRR